MKNKLMRKISILSVSLMVASAVAMSANIPAMARTFSDIPLALVENLITIPSLFLMISVLISGFIARRIGYKRTILIGIGMVAVCGIVPVISSNFYLIFISRALFGFGIGLFNSLLVVMVKYFYDDDECSILFGFQSACEGLGGVAIVFIAGQLLKINWQISFLAYIISIPIFILFAIFVPNVPTNKIILKTEVINNKQEQEDKNLSKASFLPVLGYIVLIFTVAVLYMTMCIKTTTLMGDIGYGTATDGSTVNLMVGLGAMIAGLVFGKLVKVTQGFTLPIAFLLLASAMFLIGFSNSVLLTAIGGLIIGFAFRIIMPYLINKINSGTIKNSGLATSLLLVGYNLGACAAPYGAIILEKISWVKSLRGTFYTEGIILVIFAVCGIAITIFYLSKKETNNIDIEENCS
jgi:MFS family permease